MFVKGSPDDHCVGEPALGDDLCHCDAACAGLGPPVPASFVARQLASERDTDGLAHCRIGDSRGEQVKPFGRRPSRSVDGLVHPRMQCCGPRVRHGRMVSEGADAPVDVLQIWHVGARD